MYYETQELPCCYSEGTLCEIQSHLVLSYCLEGLAQVPSMLSSLLRFGDHIIYVHLHRSSYLLFEHLVHHTLVGGTCIFKTEGHYLVIVESLSGDETGLVLVGGMHHDLVVP